MKSFCSKAFLAAAVALAAGSAHAQEELIAYWNQNSNDLPGGGFGFLADPDDFPQAADAGTGSLTVGGGILSETETDGNGNEIYSWIPSFGGSTVNALFGDPGGGSISIQGGTDTNNNGAWFQFEFSMDGYENLMVSYATRGTGSGFDTQTWSWSLDNSSFTDFETVTGTNVTSFFPVDFTAPADLDDATTVYLRVTFSGATGATGNNRLDNISFSAVPLGTGPLPVTPVFGTAFTSNYAGDQVLIRFSTPPSEVPEAADFSLDDASGVTVTAIEDIVGEDDSYRLTLSGPASGDTTLDTLSFDNGTDNPASVEFYAGIMDLQTVRDTVDTAGDWLSTLEVAPGGQGGYNVTVRGVVVDQTVGINSGRNMTVQQGVAGLLVRGNFGDDFRTVSDIGDEILFAGNVDHFNGLLQVFNRTANDYDLLLDNNGPATIPAPNAIDASTATAFDYEMAESTIVVLENVEMVDAGSTFGSSAANYDIVGGGDVISVRIQGEVADVFDGAAIPSGILTLTGVLTQFDTSDPRDESYQIAPRTLDDIAESTSVRDWSLF